MKIYKLAVVFTFSVALEKKVKLFNLLFSVTCFCVILFIIESSNFQSNHHDRNGMSERSDIRIDPENFLQNNDVTSNCGQI